jgi:hypothetical protein
VPDRNLSSIQNSVRIIENPTQATTNSVVLFPPLHHAEKKSRGKTAPNKEKGG